MPTAKQGRASIDIAAPPELVYDLIADVPRMGEWSPECYRCKWLDGTTSAAVGARFRGYNRVGRYRWATTAVITTADRGREFAFTVVHDETGRDETAGATTSNRPRPGHCSPNPSTSCGAHFATASPNCSSPAAASSTAVSSRPCNASRPPQSQSTPPSSEPLAASSDYLPGPLASQMTAGRTARCTLVRAAKHG